MSAPLPTPDPLANVVALNPDAATRIIASRAKPPMERTGSKNDIATVYPVWDGKVLIHRRKEDPADPSGGHIGVPGGSIDVDGTTFSGTAIREAEEEAGLEIVPDQLQHLSDSITEIRQVVNFYVVFPTKPNLSGNPTHIGEVDQSYKFTGIPGEDAGNSHWWAPIDGLLLWLEDPANASFKSDYIISALRILKGNVGGGGANPITFRGITNTGNSCYFASALQMLRLIPSITAALTTWTKYVPTTVPIGVQTAPPPALSDVSKYEEAATALKNIMQELAKPDPNPIDITGYYSKLLGYKPQFAIKGDSYPQQDSSEFLESLVFDLMDLDENLSKPLRDDIRLTIEQQTSCKAPAAPDASSLKFPHNILQLKYIAGNNTNIQKLLESTSEDVNVERCGGTSTLNATKTETITSVSENLIFRIVRENVASGKNVFDNTVVAINPEITVKGVKFYATAAIIKSGSASGGHYWLDTFVPGTNTIALKINDSTISVNPVDEPIDTQAVVVLYSQNKITTVAATAPAVPTTTAPGPTTTAPGPTTTTTVAATAPAGPTTVAATAPAGPTTTGPTGPVPAPVLAPTTTSAPVPSGLRRNINSEARAKFDQYTGPQPVKEMIQSTLNIFGDIYNLQKHDEMHAAPKTLVQFMTEYGINIDYGVPLVHLVQAFLTVFPDPASGLPITGFGDEPAFHVICNYLQYRILTLNFEIQLKRRSSLLRTELLGRSELLQGMLVEGKCGTVSQPSALDAFLKSMEAKKPIGSDDGCCNRIEAKMNFLLKMMQTSLGLNCDEVYSIHSALQASASTPDFDTLKSMFGRLGGTKVTARPITRPDFKDIIATISAVDPKDDVGVLALLTYFESLLAELQSFNEAAAIIPSIVTLLDTKIAAETDAAKKAELEASKRELGEDLKVTRDGLESAGQVLMILIKGLKKMVPQLGSDVRTKVEALLGPYLSVFLPSK